MNLKNVPLTKNIGNKLDFNWLTYMSFELSNNVDLWMFDQ